MHITRFSRIAALSLAGTIAAAPGAAAQTITNPGFEDGAPELRAWELAPAPHYAAALDSADAKEGRWAARVTGQAGGAQNEFGNLLQRLDAVPLRNKRVRYRAWVRTELAPGPSRSGIWMRVDRPNGGRGFFDNMGSRPVLGRTGWQQYEITGNVAADAEAVMVGMLLVGAGQAWVDAASLEVLGDVPTPEAARPLSPRGVENLAAFARLLGYVRYFHPSDQAAATDWNAFAWSGVRAVESAPDAARLAAVLDSLFRPVAPTVAIRAGDPGAAAPEAAAPSGDAARIVWWRHYGVGLSAGDRSPYRSARASIPLGGALPDSVPDPAEPLRVRLGGGVGAVIPTALFADAGGTLPRAAAPPAAPVTPGSGDDRATRLANVALAWNVFQHFYPYFDVVDADWPAELPRALASAATDAGECAFLGTMRRLVAALDDGHGRVGHACEGPQRTPPVLLESVEGRPTVIAVGAGVEGVRLGDVVLRVDGRSADSLVAAQGELVSAATPGWRSYLANGRLLFGRDSVVRITVQHVDGDTATVALRRPLPPQTIEERKPEPVAEVRPGIWYVDLDRVTQAQFVAAVPSLERASGLVFDLRGYPDGLDPFAFFSHLIREPGASAQWHIPVVTRPDNPGQRFDARDRWSLQPAAPYLAAPRVFITDGRAISYAESVMGIVEAYRLGEIVGQTTAGTNGNVNPMELPGGYSIGWTGMRVLKHDGSRHHGVGIRPTVPAERTRAGVAAGRDELLEKAIEVVSRAQAR
ncbi:MAG TPA: S41 family peptidase [Longimicrobium sp.]